MKRFPAQYIFPALFLLVLGTALGVKLEAFISGPDALTQLRKLEDAYLIISQQYVEDVDPDAVAESAITGMLAALDPHSVYISPREIAELQDAYRGSFGGIGIWFEVPNDTAQVVSTIVGGPSEAVGVLAGDRIIAIEDSGAVGLDSRAIQRRLKGPVGTPVRVTVRRPGLSAPIDFTITRDQIALHSIDSAYLVDDQTGYIKVSRFAMTTAEEFKESLETLRARGMQRLILDLRDNQGGVMEDAVALADQMLDGGKTIVYTESRNREYNTVERSTDGGLFEEQPVIVLVNESSASASEIVAGALQDHDRALIVGQRTFGKGLVQRQFELTDGSVLQMTVSRYFTPSGRLIQTPYHGGDLEAYYEQKYQAYDKATFDPDRYKEGLPDSLKFQTVSGRVVYGGGGIMPDVVVAPDTTSLFWAINRSALDFFFVRDWFGRNEKSLRSRWGNQPEAFASDYSVGDALWTDFWRFAEEKGLQLTDEPSAVSLGDGIYARADVASIRPLLEQRLKGHLIRQLFGYEAAVPFYNQTDPVFLLSLDLWEQAGMLTREEPSRRRGGSGR